MITTENSLVHELEAVYQDIRGTTRNIRNSDRLAEDLDLDSLAAVELLVELEHRLNVVLVGDSRLASVERVADLIQLVMVIRAETPA